MNKDDPRLPGSGRLISDWKSYPLLEAFPEPVALCDLHGLVLYINPAFEQTLGWSASEVVSLWSASGSTDGWLEQWRSIRRLCADLRPITFETTGWTKNGRPLDLQLRSAPINDPGGKAVGFLLILRDISEIKSAHRALEAQKRKLSELTSELAMAEERERRRIAVDLHDSVTQNLALGIARLNGMVENGLKGDHSAQLTTIIGYLENCLSATRSLSFELSPPVLYDFGLEAALEWLADHVTCQYGLKTRFVDDGRAKPLSDILRVILYRAARELILNAVKHSGATRAQLSVSRTGDLIRVRVEDNGVGMSHRDPGSHTDQGFGLFSIRERLGSHGGAIEFESRRHGGLMVTMSAPIQRVDALMEEISGG